MIALAILMVAGWLAVMILAAAITVREDQWEDEQRCEPSALCLNTNRIIPDHVPYDWSNDEHI